MTAKTKPEEPEAQEPEAQEPEAPAETAMVFLAGPPWCTAFNFLDPDTGMIEVTRAGVEVPSHLLGELKQSADKSGVTLSMEVSN